ncbi:MAG: phosphatidylserine decarboxylase, partial [Epsilonproteobacteria bacterium]|nr:phosphatidylserine decarboxylase [Campylobacterota bacterium]
LVTQLGKVEKGKAFQIKGMEYEVEKLLEGAKEVKKILEGEYINLYLSPKDYHRFHMPLKLKVERLIHLPGKLYPVNFFYLKRKKNLFIENERVILECKTQEGKVAYIVLVGALNVGKIKIVFEKRLQTNRSKTPRVFEYKNLWLEKGELLGYFMMGSTILLFFEPNFCKWVVEVGEKVRFGQQIAKRGESSLV